jgi:hypothetical protein
MLPTWHKSYKIPECHRLWNSQNHSLPRVFVKVRCNGVMELNIYLDSLLNIFTRVLLFTSMALHSSHLMHWMVGVCMCVILFNPVLHLYYQSWNYMQDLRFSQRWLWRVSSSGIWHCVVRWVAPDVSDSTDYAASYPRRWYSSWNYMLIPWP